MGRPPVPAEVRFWAKVDKQGPIPVERPELGPCWVWTAGRGAGGYGKFSPSASRTCVAHRYGYELQVGSVPDGLTLDHLCRNRACVRASHLEPVTSKVNILRGEGLAAKNAAKTHCDNGHLFSEANTLRTSIQRVCRICGAEKQARYRLRKQSKPDN